MNDSIITHDTAKFKTSAEIDAMIDYHKRQGTLQVPELVHRNGQILVEVNGLVAARIMRRWCEVELRYRFSHTRAIKGDWGWPYWDDIEDAAWDAYFYWKGVK